MQDVSPLITDVDMESTQGEPADQTPMMGKDTARSTNLVNERSHSTSRGLGMSVSGANKATTPSSSASRKTGTPMAPTTPEVMPSTPNTAGTSFMTTPSGAGSLLSSSTRSNVGNPGTPSKRNSSLHAQGNFSFHLEIY